MEGFFRGSQAVYLGTYVVYTTYIGWECGTYIVGGVHLRLGS